jgi:hemoglobin-like flavoprotein
VHNRFRLTVFFIIVIILSLQLGPDFDELEEFMSDLGETHRKLGIVAEYFPLFCDATLELPEYFPLFCDAMLEVLADGMGKDWTNELEIAWEEVLGGLSTIIVRSMKK